MYTASCDLHIDVFPAMEKRGIQALSRRRMRLDSCALLLPHFTVCRTRNTQSQLIHRMAHLLCPIFLALAHSRADDRDLYGGIRGKHSRRMLLWNSKKELP